eukprot:gnl/MRDRNA2_/MRDRNA2_33458_c0_seq1.p1 gnl/MRDRNA2_/MRDRNA2_33458_c0~~gnl/MRDRNA2_/MRDRNA2_33458_c0_seq1.p1  ORF type:complete len:415 (+),score=57.67 gnl/MRDRNA2_/MRDRNA2_33458_c0_seq1:49-1293(+)
MISSCAAGAAIGCLSGIALENLWEKASSGCIWEAACRGLHDSQKKSNQNKQEAVKGRASEEDWLRVKQKVILGLCDGSDNGLLGESLCAINEAQVRTKMQSQLLSSLESVSLAATLDVVSWKQRVQQKVQRDLSMVGDSSRETSPQLGCLHADQQFRGGIVPTLALPAPETQAHSKCRPQNLNPMRYRPRLGQPVSQRTFEGSTSTFESESSDQSYTGRSVSSDLTVENDASYRSPSDPDFSELCSPRAPRGSGADADTNEACAKTTGFDSQIQSESDQLQLQDVLVSPRQSSRIGHPQAIDETCSYTYTAEWIPWDSKERLTPRCSQPQVVPIFTPRTAQPVDWAHQGSQVLLTPRRSQPQVIPFTPRKGHAQVTKQAHCDSESQFLTPLCPPPLANLDDTEEISLKAPILSP